MSDQLVAKLSQQRAAGFNYGTGWGSAPKPPVFFRAAAVARRLGKAATEAAAVAWELEMAIRDVRLAETGAEKAKAILALETILARHELGPST